MAITLLLKFYEYKNGDIANRTVHLRVHTVRQFSFFQVKTEATNANMLANNIGNIGFPLIAPAAKLTLKIVHLSNSFQLNFTRFLAVVHQHTLIGSVFGNESPLLKIFCFFEKENEWLELNFQPPVN